MALRLPCPKFYLICGSKGWTKLRSTSTAAPYMSAMCVDFVGWKAGCSAIHLRRSRGSSNICRSRGVNLHWMHESRGAQRCLLQALSPKQFAAERFDSTRNSATSRNLSIWRRFVSGDLVLGPLQCPQNGIFEAPLPRKEVRADLLAEFEKGALPKKRDHGNLRTQFRWLKSARMVRQAALKRAGPCKPARHASQRAVEEPARRRRSKSFRADGCRRRMSHSSATLTSLQMAVSLLIAVWIRRRKLWSAGDAQVAF